MNGPGKGADRGAWEQAHTIADAEEPLEGRLDALVGLAGRSKAARRGVAAALVGRAGIVAALADRADEAPGGSVKDLERLLRRAAAADVDARRRANPIRRNEAFVCDHCGHDVPPAPGGGVRNHCPRCLRSRHVDGEVPGDRAARCGGLMDPIGWSGDGGTPRVFLRCRRCGHERANRLRPDWRVDPDRDDALRALGGG